LNVSPHADLFDWSDFIGREEFSISESARGSMRGKRILVTGAGGSIGSALAKELAQYGPSELVLLDHSELGLYELDRHFQAARGNAAVRLVIGSVCDWSFVQDLFRHVRPHIIFHAAACKHVPLLETNAFAAAVTNVLGTRLIAEAAGANGAEQCILLSTDKAVEATSIMGATKRIAECIFLTHGDSTTVMKILRLGNVLGSSGSVVPLFLEQIRRGGPVTVTHPEATRYFLTLSGAVAYLAGSASPEVSSGLFVPKLVGPHRIIDLARFLIERTSSGRDEVAIAISGLRPGDKITESMTGPNEFSESTIFEGSLQRVRTRSLTYAEVDRCLRGIEDAVGRRDLTSLLLTIDMLVPEFRHSSLLRAQLMTTMESGIL